MSQDKFTDLMTQYSSEAEAQKIAEMRAARRRIIFGRMRKTFLYLAFATTCWFAYQNRETLKTEVAEIRKALPKAPDSPYKHADEATKAKVAVLKEQAEKRNALVEDTYK